MSVKIDLFSVLIAPHITEKSTLVSASNSIVFKVNMHATKKTIKAAVEKIYGVSVKSVNTIVVKGKKKSVRGRLGLRSDYKKAIVALAEGTVIDVMQPV